MIKGMFSRKPTGNFSSRKEAQKKEIFFLHSKKLPADNSKYKGDNSKYV